MISKQQITKQCSRCRRVLSTNDFYIRKTTKSGLRCECKECSRGMHKTDICVDCKELKRIESKGRCSACNQKWLKKTNPEKYAKMQAQARKKSGKLAYSELKSCASYLGVHVAEQVLSKVFKDVNMMSMNHPGYDFICNYGKKIDVKSACRRKGRNGWLFTTKKNTTADYFLCIAFDNRESLTPMHLWLIPTNSVSHVSKASISPRTIGKWKQFELDISKTLQYCSELKQ